MKKFTEILHSVCIICIILSFLLIFVGMETNYFTDEYRGKIIYIGLMMYFVCAFFGMGNALYVEQKGWVGPSLL